MVGARLRARVSGLGSVVRVMVTCLSMRAVASCSLASVERMTFSVRPEEVSAWEEPGWGGGGDGVRARGLLRVRVRARARARVRVGVGLGLGVRGWG